MGLGTGQMEAAAKKRQQSIKKAYVRVEIMEAIIDRQKAAKLIRVFPGCRLCDTLEGRPALMVTVTGKNKTEVDARIEGLRDIHWVTGVMTNYVRSDTSYKPQNG